MTEHIWSETYARACELFGESPASGEVEAAILSAYRRAPMAVAAKLQEIGARVAAGKVAHGWSVWRLAVEEGELDARTSRVPGTRPAPPPSPPLSDEEREAVRAMIRGWLDGRFSTSRRVAAGELEPVEPYDPATVEIPF